MEKNIYEKDGREKEDEQKNFNDKDNQDELSISYMDYRYVYIVNKILY